MIAIERCGIKIIKKKKIKISYQIFFFAPFFNLALKTYAREDYYQKIKKLIKKGEKKT